MRRPFTLYLLITLLAVLALTTQQSWAADSGSRFGKLTSNSIMPFLALGELSLLADGPNGKQEAAQAAKALMAVGFATEVLKFTVREKRPNSNSRSSFPSGHTSAAFAMATVLADYKPKYALPAYGVATAIAWSRLDQHEHHLQDVIAGAALGYFTAKHFTGNHVTVSPYGVGYNWKM